MTLLIMGIAERKDEFVDQSSTFSTLCDLKSAVLTVKLVDRAIMLSAIDF